jgi:hypothetical protein
MMDSKVDPKVVATGEEKAFINPETERIIKEKINELMK